MRALFLIILSFGLCSCPIEGTLTPDAIVMIAMQNNPNLQAEFAEIGIAQGDLINAGLFSNPQLQLSVRVPNKGGFALNTDFTLTTSLLDFFLRPLKIKTAVYAQKEICAAAAHALLKLAYEAQISFLNLVYAKQIVTLREEKSALAKTALDISKMQSSCGNISNFSLRDFELDHQKEVIALEQAKKDLIPLRGTLNLIMGLPDSNELWNLSEPSPYTAQINDSNLTEMALENRYDLQAAAFDICKKAKEGRQKQWWTYTDLRLGVSTEQEVEGVQVTGPVVQLNLPLFNQGQGDRFILLHQLQQSQQRYEALRQQIIVEVNEVKDIHQALMHEYLLLKNEKLATLQAKVKESQAYYNFMAIGIFELIEIKNQELDALIQLAEIEKELAKNEARIRFVTGSSL